MARTLRDTNLETREARRRLAGHHKPYWRLLDPGRHLGYYKGKRTKRERSGSWIARYFLGEGRYSEQRLGVANDLADADGMSVLDFSQAQGKAREWFSEQAHKAAGQPIHDGPYTVAEAARDYMEWFRSRRKSVRDTEYKVDIHILPALGSMEVSKLTSEKLSKWHHALAETPARVRTPRGEDQKYREAANDPVAIRKRRSTANRILNVLKSILNRAWMNDKVSSNKAWGRVKPFEKADAPKERYLTADECTRLVNGCDKEFRPLVQAALYTGCRYGELSRLSVADLNPDVGTVVIRITKSGKPRHVVLGEEGQNFFETITAGRPDDAPMFPRDKGGRWGEAHQRWPLKRACERAKITPAIGFHILRHSYTSHLVMNGAPLHVVAHNLGHSNTAMIELHYAHLSPSYIADAIRAAAPKLGIAVPDKVVSLKRTS